MNFSLNGLRQGALRPPRLINRRGRALLLAPAVLAALALGLAPAAATAETATFSATETVPVPPASDFAGTGGGDGWSVALSSTAVFNVFHHQHYLGVACHLQSNASICPGWEPKAGQEYKEIVEPAGLKSGFATATQPGMYLDRTTGRLYVYATRIADNTAGVVCVDINSAEEDPFCGFTELSGANEAEIPYEGTIGNPVLVPHGSELRLYAFNYNDGPQAGAKNKLMCFDVTAAKPCAGQPFAVALPAGNVENWSPRPTTSQIGTDVVTPVAVEGKVWLTCWNGEQLTPCTGSWPVKTEATGVNGTVFPLLTPSGATSGVCFATAGDPCWNLSGQPVVTPGKLPEVIGEGGYYESPAVVIGPRIYIASDYTESVKCFSYSTGEGCPNFPKTFTGLENLYTVNPDPERPTCLWVNSDGGAGQIQSFDAYTGGKCGEGAVRVLAGQFVVDSPKCEPASYETIQVLKPTRSEYTSGTVALANGNGESLGLPELTLNSSGSASLVGLHLNSSSGLPQFLFTFNGLKSSGEVQVRLTWKGNYNTECIKPGQHIARPLVKAHLASTPTVCIKARSYEASVSGSPIETVTYKVNGRTVAVVRRANSHGRWNAKIGLRAGVKEHLTAYVKYQPYVSVGSSTLKRTLLRCAAPKKKPAFTG